MEALRCDTAALQGQPMVYAGRLDPMAEGLLLVLTGEDRHALPAHLKHDKEYVATFLFGLGSDTFDVLGRLTWGRVPAPNVEACAGAVAALVGLHPLPLPVWSAYRVRGRPLHAWAREGRLGAIEVPVRAMEVTSVRLGTSEWVQAAEVAVEAMARINEVRGAFRQEDVLGDWGRLVAEDPPLVRVTATLTVASGTYVRALAQALGAQVGCGGLLGGLRRTRIGPYLPSDPDLRLLHTPRSAAPSPTRPPVAA